MIATKREWFHGWPPLSPEWFAACFDRKGGQAVPPDIQAAAQAVCLAYGISGLCDPMYVANRIALALNRGDGHSHFWGEPAPKVQDYSEPRTYRHSTINNNSNERTTQ